MVYRSSTTITTTNFASFNPLLPSRNSTFFAPSRRRGSLSSLALHKRETFSPPVDSKVPFFFTLLLHTLSLFKLNELGVFVVSDSMEKLPKLVEDIVETSLNTGPRGVLRLAQGVQAFIGVGQEWLTDVSKVTITLYHRVWSTA